MCWITFALFRRTTADTGATLVFFGAVQMVLIVVFGTTIGLGGSLLSVGRHLKNV